MDFKYRAIDNQPPSAAASSSGFSSDRPLQEDSPSAELVKQRIKEEIMIREIASRRMMEAEIRRELIVEQELAMLRATGRRTTERLEFDDEHFAVRLLEQRLNQIVDPSSYRGLLAIPGSSSSLNLLPVRPFSEPREEEMKPLVHEKDKTFLPKPDPEKFEAKRKAKGPPLEADDTHTDTEPIPSISSLKKSAKKVFICTMCKITTTGEITLNTHLKGKKHRAKEGRCALQTGDDVLHNKITSPVGEEAKDTEKPALQNKGGFKCWCEICQIGTQSMVVMETHNKGRKHRARLLKEKMT